MAETAVVSKAAQRTRFKWLIIAGGSFIVIGLFYAAYWFTALRHFERTDDAYVQGNLVQITPQVPGTVVAVNADDTDFVKAGAPLVALDRADAEVALAQAQAVLAQTVREVRSLYSANATGSANVTLRQAEVTRARADLAKAEDDLARRQGLKASGAVSGEELNHAQSGVSNASAALAATQAALVAAQQQLATSQNLTDGATVRNASERRARRGESARGISGLCAHGAAGAGLGLCGEADRAGRPAGRAGRAVDGDRSARPGLGRRQFQGGPAA